jgi:hypothetical protein
MSLRRSVLTAAACLVITAGMASAQGQNKYGKPQSIIHVVTLYYKPDTTEEQKKAVLAGVEKMAAEIPGIKNIWLRSIKVQGERREKGADGQEKAVRFTDAFVMEFENQAAFEKYDDHPAHRAWEKIYLPVRGSSWSHDITN